MISNHGVKLSVNHLQERGQPVHLDFQLLNDQLMLSWNNTGFSLKSAPAIIGPFTNLPAATSPCTNAPVGPQQFFRLKED